MRELTERCPCGPIASQHLSAAFKRQVRRHHDAVPLVGRGDHLEQQFRASLVGRTAPLTLAESPLLPQWST